MEPDGFDRVEGFVGSWRFAFTAISLLVFFALALSGLLLVPDGDGAFATFAADFRRWCFGFGAERESTRTGMIATTFSELFILALMIGLVWLGPLRTQLRRGVRPLVPYAATSALIVCAMVATLGFLSRSTAEDPTAFPATALRTTLDPPRFSLHDQDGEAVSLESLRGRVVLLTAVYATCGYSCPTVMAQTKRVVATLSEADKEQLTVVAVTLDPEHDTREVLTELAREQKIAAPLYRLLTGEPAAVNAVLDAMQIARAKNERTGAIEHANVFLLVDKAGRLAYRFSLGALQERWLTEALELLVDEPRPLSVRE